MICIENWQVHFYKTFQTFKVLYIQQNVHYSKVLMCKKKGNIKSVRVI